MELEKRSCGSCTKCCDGWLHGEAHGHRFWPGRPCHFVGESGCSIYKDRPHDPCKTYSCEWLINDDIPLWMKPDKINAILTKKRKKGVEYVEVSEAGEKLRVEVLDWLVFYGIAKKKNIKYYLSGTFNKLGFGDLEDKFLNDREL